MARIAIGVQGHGLGHANRCLTVIDALRKKHELLIFSSSRAYEFLKKKYGPIVHEAESFHLHYSGTSVSPLTIIRDFLPGYHRYRASLQKAKELLRTFHADFVINDFDPVTGYAAHSLRIPIINIDNEHLLTHTKIPYAYKQFLPYIAARWVTAWFNPPASYYIIPDLSTFEPRAPNTFIVPPVIRPEVLHAKPHRGKHFLVYQTSHTYDDVLPMLHSFPNERFVIYKGDEHRKEGNITFKPLHHSTYIDDLRSARGIITNGGLTLISEALYLRKPLYTVPLRGQFEQAINSMNVSNGGYGLYAKGFTTAEFRQYLNNIPVYERALARRKQNGNALFLKKLQECITLILGERHAH